MPEENLLLDFYEAREDNRGRHTDHPDGRHSIWTNQRPISNIPHFFTRDALPVATLPLYPGLRQAPNMLVCTPSGGSQFGNICLDSLCVCACVCVCVRIVAKRLNGASCFFGVRVTAEDNHIVPGADQPMERETSQGVKCWTYKFRLSLRHGRPS